MDEKKEFDYTEAAIKKNRSFPTRNVVIIIILIALQGVLVLLACLYNPKPQDEINSYTVTVEPLSDGSLDIEYSLIWTPLDEDEPLSWIEIGVANPNYTIDQSSKSGAVSRLERHEDGDYVSVIARLDKEYKAGETLSVSFKINQRGMLTTRSGGYYYEFVPCWFNSTPVKEYALRWKSSESIRSSNLKDEGEYLVTRGSLEAGEYIMAKVSYLDGSFDGAKTVSYTPFDDGGVYNDLNDDKGAVIALCIFGVLIMLIVEIYLADSFVSYHRGRGFIRSYGYHIHTFGRVNPHYRSEANKRAAASRGSGRSFGGGRGGCACACACACAGGGRAGCSRKDTTLFPDADMKKE